MWRERPDGDPEPLGPPKPARAVVATREAGGSTAKRRRLLALAGAAVVAAALVGLLAALHGSTRVDGIVRGTIDRLHVLRPLDTTTDSATGERIAHFDGFAVSVETQPPGALVQVDGVQRGEAPVLAGVDCEPGTDVEIRAQKTGFKPARTRTLCRSDTLVKLVVRLRR